MQSSARTGRERPQQNGRGGEQQQTTALLRERETTWMTRVQQLEKEKKELESTWMTRVAELERKHKELLDTKKTLTTTIQVLEEDKRALDLVKEEERQREESETRMKNKAEEVKVKGIKIQENNMEENKTADKDREGRVLSHYTPVSTPWLFTLKRTTAE